MNCFFSNFNKERIGDCLKELTALVNSGYVSFCSKVEFTNGIEFKSFFSAARSPRLFIKGVTSEKENFCHRVVLFGLKVTPQIDIGRFCVDLFFNLNEISKLTSKAELGCITLEEHSYLQKIIAAQTVINQYTKSSNQEKNTFQIIASRYYSWISKNWQKKNKSSRERTDLFLLKNALEKVNFSVTGKEKYFYGKPLNHFDTLRNLAEIWEKPLKCDENSIVYFLSYLMENIYGIPKKLIDDIFNLIFSNWKPVLSPLGSIPSKKFSVGEIEEYFFGKNTKPEFEIHVIDKIDRHFSVVGVGHKNHIFLSKRDDYDLFEAALVVHELQHIVDAVNESNPDGGFHSIEKGMRNCISDNLFLSERSALNAERVFLLGHGTAKRGRYYWLESNLFYPILLLKCELHNLIFRDNSPIDFAKVCLAHGMEPLPLPSLFEWGAPFQMSAYCASAMELEQNWLKFLQ
jgi:hypothetical protein